MKCRFRRARSAGVAVALACLMISAGRAADKPPCSPDDRECIESLAARLKASGWVGVVLDRDKPTDDFTVITVIPDSPAEKAGIRPGDILVAINGMKVSEHNDESLSAKRKNRKPGDSVTYTMRRDGADRELNLILAPMPAKVLARYLALYLGEQAASPGDPTAQSEDKPEGNDR